MMSFFFPLADSQYIPFVHPLWGVWNYWYLLLFPLCIAISIVYKSIKCASMRDVPRSAIGICFWIIIGMGTAAALLAGIVKLLEI